MEQKYYSPLESDFVCDGFPLWQFQDSYKIVITRGRTCKEAFIHASKSWRRGEAITPVNYVLINTKKLYTLNHSFDWLHIPPKRLKLGEK